MIRPILSLETIPTLINLHKSLAVSGHSVSIKHAEDSISMCLWGRGEATINIPFSFQLSLGQIIG